jgi:hypothetical protein
VRGDGTLMNSTVTGNSAQVAGGIASVFGVTLDHATVVDNTGAGPFVANLGISGPLFAGRITSFASVVALPRGGGPNCGVTFALPTSSSFTYSDDSTCGFTGPGDVQNGANPHLAPLGNRGGPTETRVPRRGSPLINGIPLNPSLAIPPCGVPTDQRGVTRPQLSGCDCGAVEVDDHDLASKR